MNNCEDQSKILDDGLEADYSVVEDDVINEMVGEKNPAEIVKEAIKSEQDFVLLKDRLRKEHSELFAKAWAKDKELKRALAGQELVRNTFAGIMPEIADVFPSPDTLQKFLDNGCRWARIFGGDVPQIYQDAFIKGEVLVGQLYIGGPYKGEPCEFTVEREGNRLKLIKYSTGDYWLAKEKFPELKKLPQLREILAEREIDQAAI